MNETPTFDVVAAAPAVTRQTVGWRVRIIRVALLILLLALVPLAANLWIVGRGMGRVYSDAGAIPEREVGLVLGCGARLRDGRENRLFTARIAAAAELYKQGKIKYILLSGDNGSVHYDEPTAMRKAIVKLGVPRDVVYLDYAGFRTLDSVVRAKKVFGLDSFTIISQGYHDYRAVAIARHYDIDAVAFAARDISRWGNFAPRELAARAWACVDIYILHRKPKYLGKREYIGATAPAPT